MKKTHPIYAFNHYVDLIKIKDSMQIDSGTVIATLQVPDAFLSLEVKGYVKVFWNPDGKSSDVYKYPSDFPQELKDLIANNEKWFEDERLTIDENNWFEIFIGKDDEDPAPISDVVDVEGLSSKEIEDLMLDILNNHLNYGDYNHKCYKNKTKEYTIPVEWTVRENIKVEAISFEKAIEWARANKDEIPCGDSEFVEGSWKISCDEGQPAHELAEKFRSWGGVFKEE